MSRDEAAGEIFVGSPFDSPLLGAVLPIRKRARLESYGDWLAFTGRQRYAEKP